MVAVVTHQCAGVALRVIVLVTRKTVVDQEQRTAPQNACPLSRPRRSGKVDFTQITGRNRAFRGQRQSALEQEAVSRSVDPGELAIASDADSSLLNNVDATFSLPPNDKMYRQGY